MGARCSWWARLSLTPSTGTHTRALGETRRVQGRLTLNNEPIRQVRLPILELTSPHFKFIELDSAGKMP
jgi:hypothetical protein